MYTVAQIKTNCLNQLQVTYYGFISVLNNCNLATKHDNIIVLLTLTLLFGLTKTQLSGSIVCLHSKS